MRLALLMLGVVLASGASGQNFIDPFNYPAGTTVPGYTENRGDWSCLGTTVRAQQLSTAQELTFDSVTDGDAAVELLAIYNTAAPALQFVGPIVRYSGASATSFFMIKLQDNTTPYTGFDRFFVYYNGSAFGINFQDINPPTTAARVRIQAVDEVGSGNTRVNVYVDTDLDGLWNYTAETTTTLGYGTVGRIGIAGYGGAIADDLEYFPATLRGGALPTIGTSMPIYGRGSNNVLYLAAASLGHTGFSAGGGVWVPLDLDLMFDLSVNTPSIFQNFFGFTAPDGTFTLTLNIPNLPQLVGGTIWVGAVTTTGTSVLEVAPEVQVTFL